jgi:hypothetical protein
MWERDSAALTSRMPTMGGSANVDHRREVRCSVALDDDDAARRCASSPSATLVRLDHQRRRGNADALRHPPGSIAIAILSQRRMAATFIAGHFGRPRPWSPWLPAKQVGP